MTNIENNDILCLIYKSTADTHQSKGNCELAYAKNGKGDEHYAKAKINR